MTTPRHTTHDHDREPDRDKEPDRDPALEPKYPSPGTQTRPPAYDPPAVSEDMPDALTKAKRPPRAPRDAAPPAPSITVLLPDTAAVGDPSFTLRVIGADFDEAAVIVVAGEDEPTTYISSTELSTGWNMPLWQGPDPAIPVLVRGADGQSSNTVPFVLTPPREVPLDPAYASKPTPAIDSV